MMWPYRRLHQSEEKFKVHGSIQSSSFLVAAGYRVKVMDFNFKKLHIKNTLKITTFVEINICAITVYATLK